ncbi:hypothetical protein MKX08_008175 [Trichoderma sp. CBMAI-0020]|nr:hypothetical protein MKX08_008175 [Trichoderma sp. CBMAI-0020]
MAAWLTWTSRDEGIVSSARLCFLSRRMPNAWFFSELAVPSLSPSHLASAADSTAEQSPRADIRTSYSRLSARLSLVRSVLTAMPVSKAVHPTAEPGPSPSPSRQWHY